MREIDLHVHTTASDGTCTPREVVRRASELGLRAIAVTDHDNITGHAEALSAGMDYGVDIRFPRKLVIKKMMPNIMT